VAAHKKKTPRIELATPIPILRMYDHAKTVEFYAKFLGFEIDWEHRFHEGAPVYMQVSRDACKLQLSEHFGDGTPGTKVKVETRELEEYCRALNAKKYRHARTSIVDHDWGERSMAIADPAGNAVIFFERTTR
jgi:catechol 2,3-dioxygenase-like lactoylglutathione lyase family enzyme